MDRAQRENTHLKYQPKEYTNQKNIYIYSLNFVQGFSCSTFMRTNKTHVREICNMIFTAQWNNGIELM